MKELAFFTKNGDVSAYSFACGYVQRATKLSKDTDARYLNKELYREHNIYHVRSTDNNSPELNSTFIGPVSHKFKIWESFESLSKARIFYKSIKL